MKRALILLLAAIAFQGCSAPADGPARKPQAVVASEDATCSGSDSYCNACKNCKYCKHCSKDGGTCKVCK